MNSEESASSKLQYLVPVLIFFLFFVTYGSVYLASAGHLASDDVYFHASAAMSYLAGDKPDYPVYTTFATRPADIWYGYHWFMALFIRVFGGNNYGHALDSLKFMNSLLVGFYFSLFYLITRSLSKELVNLNDKRSMVAGITATISLYALCSHFDFRLLIIRPHLFLSLFFLLSVFSLIRNKFWPLFIMALVTPIIYSFSLLILLPPALYFLSTIVYEQFKFSWSQSLKPGLFAVAGLLVGIVLRPDSLNYVYNGFWGPILALAARFSGAIGEASELGNPVLSFPDLLWLLPFIISMAIYIIRYLKHRSFARSISFSRFYLAIVTCSLFVLYMLVDRASEYFFPFLALFVTLTVSEIIVSPLESWLPESHEENLVFQKYLAEPIKKIFGWFVENKKTAQIAGTMILVVFFGAVTLTLTLWQIAQPPQDEYKGAAEFIYRDSGGKGIVFTQFFHMFPPLVFYNNRNNYIMGIDPVYTFSYDQRLYYLWSHAIQGETICPKVRCGSEDQSPGLYDALKTEFKAAYVFVDHSSKLGNALVDNTPKFAAGLARDNRFKKVYTDSKYPEIEIYKLE